MKPKRIGMMQAIDVETGEVIEERQNAAMILPPTSGCVECGTDHAWDAPHNQQSLKYQYQYYATHGRWPSWSDAMAHCPDPVRQLWREELRAIFTEMGEDIPADLAEDLDGKGGGRA